MKRSDKPRHSDADLWGEAIEKMRRQEADFAQKVASGHFFRIEDIPGSENEKRALEVAAVGLHSVRMSTSDGRTSTFQAALALAFATAFPDMSAAMVTQVAERPHDDGYDITVHAARLSDGDILLPPPRDVTVAVQVRVEMARRLDIAAALAHPARALLDEAGRRLGLDKHSAARTVAVAQSVARLDAATRVLAHSVAAMATEGRYGPSQPFPGAGPIHVQRIHVAEALSYCA